MDRRVAPDPEVMKDIEDFMWDEVVAADASEHIGERIVMRDLHTGALGDNTGHALGKLSGLDQGRIRIVHEISLGMSCQNYHRAIYVFQVIEVLAAH